MKFAGMEGAPLSIELIRRCCIELMMYSVRPQYRQATQCETATHLQRNTPITFPAVGKQTHAHTHTPTLEKSNK